MKIVTNLWNPYFSEVTFPQDWVEGAEEAGVCGGCIMLAHSGQVTASLNM